MCVPFPSGFSILRTMPETNGNPPAGDLPKPVRCAGGFRNPERHEDRSWLEVLRWKLTTRAARWPEREPLVERPLPPASAVGLTATWVGHSTFLVRSAAGAWLTDPVWSERIGPFGGVGPRRARAPGVAFEALPAIDAVWLSHDHYDHCDLPTLRRIAREHPRSRLVSPPGHEDLARRAGFGAGRHVVLDWWRSLELAPGHRLTATPARHWGNRLSGRRNQRLWCGWHLAAPDAALHFAGDTALDEGMFAAVRRELGAPELALLPIGAYAPRWFMKEQHCDPGEAVRLFLALGARRGVGMHWGTFRLTDEPRDEPVRLLAEATRAAGLGPQVFNAIDVGDSVAVARQPD